MPSSRADVAPTVLVVDDEELVRGLICRMVAEQGWTAVDASNGLTGLEIVDRGSPRVDALVVDLMMPRLGGQAVAEVVRRHRPDLALVCMTGFSAGAGRTLEAAGIPVLRKPFSSPILIGALHADLARARAAGAAARELAVRAQVLGADSGRLAANAAGLLAEARERDRAAVRLVEEALKLQRVGA